MTDEVLVDTNVVVYAYDLGEPVKGEQATIVLRRLRDYGRGRLSTQVLGEFFRVATARPGIALSHAEALGQVSAFAASWTILPVTSMVVLEAARGVRDHRLNYWDAQIWATARLNQIPLVLSEDFRDGLTLGGVRFINPFARAFDPASL
jgi:predicted nucleic acid-binding protein